MIAGIGHNCGPVSSIQLPVFGTGWAAIRDDMKHWLRGQGLPGDAVLIIGEADYEREIMAVAGLAGSVSGQSFW